MDSEIYLGWNEYYARAAASAWKDEAEPAVGELMQRAPTGPLQVADLGCGDGRNLWPWAERGDCIVGVDIAPIALERIRDRLARGERRQVILLCQDFTASSLIGGQYDVVQCYDALPQVDRPADALREMARLAKPGGLVSFNVFTPRDCAFGEGEAVERNSFVFNRTLFRFFEAEEVRAMLPGSMEIADEAHRRWTDPPHFPFRPYEHVHDGIFFTCVVQ